MADFWDAAKGVLGVVAPMLATAVGGPLAGTATTAIISALGLAADTPPEQVAAAVAGANGEQLAKLKQADDDFRVQMRELNIAADKLVFGDRASARDQTVNLAKAGSAVAWGAPAVSVMVLAVFAAMSWQVFHMAPGEATVLQIGMVEILKAAAISVVGYWVGSSAGSDRKSDMLANSTPNAGGAAPRPLA